MKKYYKILIGIVVILAIGSGYWYFFQPDIILVFSAVWIIIIALLLWFGNRLLTLRLDRFMPWSIYGNWRFFIQLVLGIAYLLFLINLIYYIIKTSLTTTPPVWEQMIVVNFWGAVIFIPVFSLYFSLHFLKHWRTSELEAEKNQKESMRAQLDSLKNHLDPHFLFNNLNILASLIEKDKISSRNFIQKFAEVYRSLLRTKSDDLILLCEELDFIEAYMYLISVRFEDHIQITTSIQNHTKNKLLPPLTLQMLLENVIKHNLITETQPLQIEIMEKEGSFLLVRNTLHTKADQSSNEQGSGLENIKKRYAHFTDQSVSVVKTETHFEVTIPLLEIENV
ncbi:MAG: histidine kinase [Cytophagia bacterium]|nr:histidine kinase [Cytophagia bacterium]